MMEEQEKMKTEELEMQKNVKQETEKIINILLDEGINADNVNFLGKVVDIHKDMEQEEYWCEKKEAMNMKYSRGGNYGNYGTYEDNQYGRGRRRDSRGRYMTSGRGGQYRGHEMMDEMAEHYGNYEEMKNRYGTDESTIKSLKMMLESAEDFFEHLFENAESQEEVEMIKRTARKIAEK